MSDMIRTGDAVVAIRDGGHDRVGLPKERPIAGQIYRVTGIYDMSYGLGCTLQGMDPRPYRGYLLFVRSGHKIMVPGWYFRKVEVADEEWTQALRDMIGSKEHEPVRDRH